MNRGYNKYSRGYNNGSSQYNSKHSYHRKRGRDYNGYGPSRKKRKFDNYKPHERRVLKGDFFTTIVLSSVQVRRLRGNCKKIETDTFCKIEFPSGISDKNTVIIKGRVKELIHLCMSEVRKKLNMRGKERYFIVRDDSKKEEVKKESKDSPEEKSKENEKEGNKKTNGIIDHKNVIGPNKPKEIRKPETRNYYPSKWGRRGYNGGYNRRGGYNRTHKKTSHEKKQEELQKFLDEIASRNT